MARAIFDTWQKWGRLTRFLQCSKIAFKRELSIWTGLEVASLYTVCIITANGDSSFKPNANEHVDTLWDEELLCWIVLAYNYSLFECCSRSKIGLGESGRLSGGIETWGADLLKRTGNNWSDVIGGRAGLIEVAAARNFVAHGSRMVGQLSIDRFKSANEACPWALGQSLVLDYTKVELCRSWLKGLMRLGNSWVERIESAH
jgi:hypothetical protein